MKRFILGLLTFLFFFCPQITYAAPPGNPNDWVMTFNDEFNSNFLDHTKWGVTARTGARNQPDRDLHWHINNTHIVSDGTLKVIAKHETITNDDPSYTPAYDPVKFPYTSGMIASKVDSNSPYLVNHSFAYGYFEARIKVPSRPGTWPAFWLLPAPGGWPPEIDIMEMHTIDTKTNYMTNHKNCGYPLIDGSKCDQVGSGYTLPVGSTSNFSTDFHTFGADWEPGLIVWYIDGVERFRTTQFVPVVNLDNPKGTTGMFIKFTLDIGKNDNPVPENFPQQMEIDYIRVYQKQSFSCNRCSMIHGCERAKFQSWTNDCVQPIPGSSVIRTTDCSCPQTNGGDNNRCTSECLPTNTPMPTNAPTPTPKPGDLNGDGKVDSIDFDKMVSNFGHPYTIFDYNVLVGNFGK